MAYVPQQHRRRVRVAKKRKGGLGDFIDDLTALFTPTTPTVPDVNVPMTPETTTTSTTTSSDPTVNAPPQPTSNWVSVGGVCKATNTTYLGMIKDFQRALNRVLDVIKPTGKIGVDGEICPLTMAALLAVSQSTSAGAYGLASISQSSCDQVAAQVANLTARAGALADFLGASSSVSSPSPASTPTYVNAAGVPTPQPITDTATDFFSNLSTMQKMMVGAGALGVGVLVFGKKKGSRR